MNENCVNIGVRIGEQIRAAIEICIKNRNVYVNYFDRNGSKRAHTSYHASGQKHIKKNGDYTYWTGGVAGGWKPMKWFEQEPLRVAGREHVSVIGWAIQSLQSVLPLMGADKVVDFDSRYTIVGFETSVVGPQAIDRSTILGFPVFWRHRISNQITVEIEAFGINRELAETPYENDF